MAGFGVSLTVLLTVSALAAVLLLLLRNRRGTRTMRVVERLPLDGKRALYVVEVAGKCLLVGAGDSLTTLAELDASRLPVEEERHPLREAWSQLKRGAR